MALTGKYLPGTSDWAREQAEQYEASEGAEANTLRGVPIIVLTSVGAKTGALRKTALMRVEHEGAYAIVASKGGTDVPPAWLWNVRKNPSVTLQDGAETREYTAREISGEERTLWWERACAVWPDYIDYQRKTERAIALFVLEPSAS